jgi:hypothetical protein
MIMPFGKSLAVETVGMDESEQTKPKSPVEIIAHVILFLIFLVFLLYTLFF